MKVHPNGCRYFVIQDGKVFNRGKVARRTTIDSLMPPVSEKSKVYVVVRPRGKLKWWLYTRKPFHPPYFVACGPDPDPLIMRAIMEV